MKKHVLVGCIDKLDKVIKTRYLYVNVETDEVKDVTLPLYQAIQAFNEKAKEARDAGRYAMMIPYEYNNGLVEYSFGCGLSHYLQADVFPLLTNAFSGDIGFPLNECRLDMYVPTDVKDILEVTGVFDENIITALLKRY
jgi:hypothetical protein